MITGARGFLGRHTARVASLRGDFVIGIGHGDWRPAEWKSWGLGIWYSSEITVETLATYARRPYAILHCAGGAAVAPSISNPVQDFYRTVLTTSSILEYARRYSPTTRVVYPSSAAVYGVAATFPVAEQCPRAPISPYGVHKAMAEQLIELYARQFQVTASIVRLFSLYGAGLRKQLLWDACRKLTAGDSIFTGTGREIRDWLHVKDAVRLMLRAVDHADHTCPTVNGGSGIGVRVKDILSHLSDTLNPNLARPQFSGVARAGDPTAFVADINAAAQWGWQPSIAWRDGLAEYTAWWKQYVHQEPRRSTRMVAAAAALES